MRNHYEQDLKAFFHHKACRTRVDILDITQGKGVCKTQAP